MHADPTNFDTTSLLESPVLLPPSPTLDEGVKGKIRVAEIQTLDELRSIEEAWWSLLKQTPGADYFRTPHWLESYIEHFGDEIDLKILVISEGGPVSYTHLTLPTILLV